MEESLKALYMAFSVMIFVIGVTTLVLMQNAFDSTYEKLLEVVSGRFIW